MKAIISVLVENKAGVLSRTASLFSRRGFNIDSLTVGVTDDETTSRMTIVADCEEHTIEQIEKQLNKQVYVLKVKRLDLGHTTIRELALIKISSTAEDRGKILDIANIMSGKIVDISHTSLTLEICDKPEKIDLIIELLQSYKILEMARTGVAAIQKGNIVLDSKEKVKIK